MPKKILAADQDRTPDPDILRKAWYGDFQLYCTAYTSDLAILQFRIEKEWITVNFNNTDILLKKKGAVLDITLTHDVDYRMFTESPGAEVFISKIDPHR